MSTLILPVYPGFVYCIRVLISSRATCTSRCFTHLHSYNSRTQTSLSHILYSNCTVFFSSPESYSSYLFIANALVLFSLMVHVCCDVCPCGPFSNGHLVANLGNNNRIESVHDQLWHASNSPICLGRIDNDFNHKSSIFLCWNIFSLTRHHICLKPSSFWFDYSINISLKLWMNHIYLIHLSLSFLLMFVLNEPICLWNSFNWFTTVYIFKILELIWNVQQMWTRWHRILYHRLTCWLLSILEFVVFLRIVVYIIQLTNVV